MIDTLKIYETLKEDITPSAAKKITEAIGQVYTELLNTVTKEEFKELKETVAELADAQKNTEQRIGELAEAQKKTEQRIEELAESQKQTEKRLDEFEKRTEENFNRVWKAIKELTEAQKKTESELRTLVQEHKKTREIVNGLSDTVGYGLEDKIFPRPNTST